MYNNDDEDYIPDLFEEMYGYDSDMMSEDDKVLESSSGSDFEPERQ